MRTAIYIRVSSQQQEENNSLEEQLTRCQAYAKQNGLQVTAVLTDIQSAYHEDQRPGVSQLLQMARAGELDAVIMRKSSRFARHFGQSETIREELMGFGVAIHYTDAGELPDTAAGRFMHRINASVHQFYVEEWVETSIANRETAARNGKWPGGGYPPFGLARNENEVVLDESEAAIIRRAYHLFLDENKSLGKIAAIFTRERIPTRRGANRWYASGIRRLMFGRHVIGELMYKDIAVTCPSIVTEEDYYQALEKAKEGRRRNDGRTVHNYLLSGGRLRCTCGATMGGRAMHRPGSAHIDFYYSCNARSRRYISDCTEPYLRLDQAETAVWGKVVKLIETGELKEVVGDILSERAGQTEELVARRNKLKNKAQTKRREISVLFDEFVNDDPIVAEQARRRIRELSTEVQGLELDARRLTRAVNQAAESKATAAEIDALTERVKEYVRKGGGALRREILDALGVQCQVEYHSGRRCIKADFFLGET